VCHLIGVRRSSGDVLHLTADLDLLVAHVHACNIHDCGSSGEQHLWYVNRGISLQGDVWALLLWTMVVDRRTVGLAWFDRKT
jgi:hypothetical protein